MTKRVTIKVYATDEQKVRIEAAAARAGLSNSKYLVKAGTRDAPLPKAEAQVRVLTLIDKTAQAIERIAQASGEGSELDALLLLRRLDGFAAQLDRITDLIAETRR
ncbi:MAG: plasmid mobilization protein [Shimia sp.]